MALSYLLTPLLTWLATGLIKFLVNCTRERRLAFDQIGYGGMPSNHAAIASSMAALIALKEGIGTPAFGVALALAFIVILDARGLRRHVGKQAEAINRLASEMEVCQKLRERIGHSTAEICVGILTGIGIAIIVRLFLD